MFYKDAREKRRGGKRKRDGERERSSTTLSVPSCRPNTQGRDPAQRPSRKLAFAGYLPAKPAYPHPAILAYYLLIATAAHRYRRQLICSRRQRSRCPVRETNVACRNHRSPCRTALRCAKPGNRARSISGRELAECRRGVLRRAVRAAFRLYFFGQYRARGRASKDLSESSLRFTRVSGSDAIDANNERETRTFAKLSPLSNLFS